MRQNDTHAQLTRLVYGLADQLHRQGRPLTCEGCSLDAEDVVEIAMPSLLCLTNQLSTQLGFEPIGYEFSLGGDPAPVFPLQAQVNSPRQFFEIAPFLVEVFDRYTSACDYDVGRIFDAAAQALDPSYDHYAAAPGMDPAALPSLWPGRPG